MREAIQERSHTNKHATPIGGRCPDADGVWLHGKHHSSIVLQ
jgi:hypothetical protein